MSARGKIPDGKIGGNLCNSFLLVRDGVCWVPSLYNYLVMPNYTFPMVYFINACVGEFVLEAVDL